MPKKVREAIETVQKDGWEQKYMDGSHRQFKHPTKSGKVTIPGHKGEDLRPEIWQSILRQAQITREQLKKLERRRKGRRKGR